MSKTQQPRKLTPRQEASAADTSAERLKTLAADPKLARLVAANPSAPAELLLELSHSDDKTVRKACTSNANTPMEALLKLGAQFPEQLLENPVFDLLLLAHPGLFDELPTATLNSLLKRDQVPVELIRWAWKHRGESTLYSLLMNPNTPADVVEELCKAKDPEVRMAAELHCSREMPEWSREIHNDEDLLRLETLDNHVIIAATERWKDIMQDIVSFGESENSLSFLVLAPLEWRLEWASRSTTPDAALLQLSKDKNITVRLAMAENRQTPPQALSQLSTDQLSKIRRTVAANCKSPAEALLSLAKDADWYVRKAVANNHQAPTGALYQLAKDDDHDVRRAVAINSSTPVEILLQLGHDDWWVRTAVASNTQTPREMLHHLAEDEDHRVRRAAATNSQTSLEIYLQLAKDREKSVREAATRNCQTTAKVLSQLAIDEQEDVRKAAAGNMQDPAEAVDLLRLAKDNDPDVRWGVAIDEKAPTDALVKLSNDEDLNVRWAVALNSKSPSEILVELANDEDPNVRNAVAANSSTPEEILIQLAGDKDSTVRSGIASNHNAPIDTLFQLAKDTDSTVRRSALENNQARSEVFKDGRHSLLVETIKAGCSGSAPSPGRRFLFTLPQCPVDILAKNLRSRSWLERFAIAGNPSTPESVLERMAQEGNQLVRRAAKANLEVRSQSAVNETPAAEENA